MFYESERMLCSGRCSKIRSEVRILRSLSKFVSRRHFLRLCPVILLMSEEPMIGAINPWPDFCFAARPPEFLINPLIKLCRIERGFYLRRRVLRSEIPGLGRFHSPVKFSVWLAVNDSTRHTSRTKSSPWMGKLENGVVSRRNDLK